MYLQASIRMELYAEDKKYNLSALRGLCTTNQHILRIEFAIIN